MASRLVLSLGLLVAVKAVVPTIPCDMGFGVSATDATCRICPPKTFSVGGLAVICKPCPYSLAAGAVNCLPRDNVPGEVGSLANYLSIGGVVEFSGGVLVATTASHTIDYYEPGFGKYGQQTLAGLKDVSGTTNGAGLDARFNRPSKMVTLDEQTVLISDTNNNRIRMLSVPGDINSGTISTLTGSAKWGNKDGTLTIATFSWPTGLAYSPETKCVYVANTRANSLRMINRVTKMVTTIAGTGVAGSRDGYGIQAQFNSPVGLTLLGGVLFVADRDNGIVRVVSLDAASNFLVRDMSTRFRLPSAVFADVKNNAVWVADADSIGLLTTKFLTLPNLRLQSRYDVMIGSGKKGAANGTFAQSSFSNIQDLIVMNVVPGLTPESRMYIADTGNSQLRVAYINAGNGCSPGQYVNTDPTAPGLTGAFGSYSLCVDTPVGVYQPVYAGKVLYACDSAPEGSDMCASCDAGYGVDNSKPSGSVGNFACDICDVGFYSQGGPWSLCKVCEYSMFVGAQNCCAPALKPGQVVTLSGGGAKDWVDPVLGGPPLVISQKGYKDGPAEESRFNTPFGVASHPDGPKGSVYVADTQNNVIRYVDPCGTAFTIAGQYYNSADATEVRYHEGVGSIARFYQPFAIEMKIGSDGKVQFYVADTFNNCIRTLITAPGTESKDHSKPMQSVPFAGTCGVAASHLVKDGLKSVATFNNPSGLEFGVGVNAGKIYVANRLGQNIRQVSIDGMVSTIAGSIGDPNSLGIVYGNVDGYGTTAQFYLPYDLVAMPDGDIYIGGNRNNVIRKLNHRMQNSEGYWFVSSIGLNPIFKDPNPSIYRGGEAGRGYADGLGITINPDASVTMGPARFSYPRGMDFFDEKNVIIAEFGNNCIRELNIDTYMVKTTAGICVTQAVEPGQQAPYASWRDGDFLISQFKRPTMISIEKAVRNGDLYIADSGNHAIRIKYNGDANATGNGCDRGFYRCTSCSSDCVPVPAGFYQPSPRMNVLYSCPQAAKNGAEICLDCAPGYGVSSPFFLKGATCNMCEVGFYSHGKGMPCTECEYSLEMGAANCNPPSWVSNSVTTLYGQKDVTGYMNGPSTMALFDGAYGLVSLKEFSVVSDTGNNAIRLLTHGFRSVSTLAGSPPVVENAQGGLAGMKDGAGAVALFNQPKGMTHWSKYNATSKALISATVLVADAGNNRIRQIVIDSTHTAVVTTFAGTGAFGNVDGFASNAQFASPNSIELDSIYNFYVTSGATIRFIEKRSNRVFTIAGMDGKVGNNDGSGSQALFMNPTSSSYDGTNDADYLYVCDGPQIRKIDLTYKSVTTLRDVSKNADLHFLIPNLLMPAHWLVSESTTFRVYPGTNKTWYDNTVTMRNVTIFDTTVGQSITMYTNDTKYDGPFATASTLGAQQMQYLPNADNLIVYFAANATVRQLISTNRPNPARNCPEGSYLAHALPSGECTLAPVGYYSPNKYDNVVYVCPTAIVAGMSHCPGEQHMNPCPVNFGATKDGCVRCLDDTYSAGGYLPCQTCNAIDQSESDPYNKIVGYHCIA